MLFDLAADVFLKSFIIVNIHRRRHVISETVFKQDSPNPNPDSLIEYPLIGEQVYLLILLLVLVVVVLLTPAVV